jgi:hypothetical protein
LAWATLQFDIDRMENSIRSTVAEHSPDPLIKSQVGTRLERNINEIIQLF